MTPTRNNAGIAHENGAIEGAARPSQARDRGRAADAGSRDFDDLSPPTAASSTRSSAAAMPATPSASTSSAPHCRILPDRRTSDYEEVIVRVTSSGGFTLRKVFYTVPSRLIGHRLRVRLYDDRLEVFIGGTHLMTLPRGRAHPNGKHDQVVNYRHVIHSLRRKPMALLNLVYRDQLFPRQAYRRTFDAHAETPAGAAGLPHHGRSSRPGP